MVFNVKITESYTYSRQIECSDEMKPLMERVKAMTDKFEACTNLVKEAADQEFHDLMARRLYEMAADCVMSHLIIQDATQAPEMFAGSAKVYVNYAEAEVDKHNSFITDFRKEDISCYRK